MGIAVGRGKLAFFRAAGHAYHFGAQRLAPLPRNQADAAGCGHEQHVLPGFDRIAAVEQIFGRHALHHAGRGLLFADEIGQLDHAVGGHDAVIGIGSRRAARITDTVTRLQAAHPGPGFLDHTGGLDAQTAGHGQRILPAPVVDIHEIQADRRLPYQHLALPRLAQFHRLHAHDFRTALCGTANHVCFHFLFPFIFIDKFAMFVEYHPTQNHKK